MGRYKKIRAEQIIDAECRKENRIPWSADSGFVSRILRRAAKRLNGARLDDNNTSLVHEGERWTVSIWNRNKYWKRKAAASSLGLVEDE